MSGNCPCNKQPEKKEKKERKIKDKDEEYTKIKNLKTKHLRAQNLLLKLEYIKIYTSIFLIFP